MKKEKLLVVKVTNPEKYVEVGSTIRRLLNSVAFKMYGGPIIISPNSLKIGITDLLDICNTYHAKYGNLPSNCNPPL